MKIVIEPSRHKYLAALSKMVGGLVQLWSVHNSDQRCPHIHASLPPWESEVAHHREQIC